MFIMWHTYFCKPTSKLPTALLVLTRLSAADMPTFMVRCVEIKKKVERPATRMDTFFRGQPVRAKTQSPIMAAPSVKAKATGPLTWVTLLGCTISIVLFTISIAFGDGMSLLATVLLSLLSTLVGIGNKWSLKLPRRPQGTKPPPGDVVIRYPNGSYLVVRCEEDVARELYFAPEEIEYNIKSPAVYRLISLVGTLMLMLGVIALANARLELQFAWAGAYIIINAAHWIAAAVPPRLHWDLTCYEITEQSVVGGPKSSNFTEALWKAILLTKSRRWVKNGNAAPQTSVWDDWLFEAEEQARTVGCHIGPLIEPEWPGSRPDKGIVWDIPKDWNAKDAWNALSDKEATEGPAHPHRAA